MVAGVIGINGIYPHVIDAETFAVLDELAAYDPAAFNEQNEAYLAKLFPEASAAKPNGNGENEAIESDTE